MGVSQFRKVFLSLSLLASMEVLAKGSSYKNERSDFNTKQIPFRIIVEICNRTPGCMISDVAMKAYEKQKKLNPDVGEAKIKAAAKSPAGCFISWDFDTTPETKKELEARRKPGNTSGREPNPILPGCEEDKKTSERMDQLKKDAIDYMKSNKASANSRVAT